MPERPTDWYQVLQVWREASQETIDNAYRRLSGQSQPGSERQRLLDEAHAVLSNRARRDELDSALAAADRELPSEEPPPAGDLSESAAIPPPPPFPATPAPPAPPIAALEDPPLPHDDAAPTETATAAPGALSPAQAVPPGAPPKSGPGRGLVTAMAAVVLLALLVSGALVAWALTRGDGTASSDQLGDGDFDLRSMQLRLEDVPGGLVATGDGEFTNQQWAQVLAQSADQVDPKLRQLEARGRIRGYRADFGWDTPFQNLGKPLIISSQSTLFADEKAATASLTGNDYCGLPVDPSKDIRELSVPRVGDQSAGFRIIDELVLDDGQGGGFSFGKRVETVICFRTGRVVNAVSQVGLEGTEDTALSLRLARKMLTRVDDALAGRNLLAAAPGSTPSP